MGRVFLAAWPYIGTGLTIRQPLFITVRQMSDAPEYIALLNPAPGFPEAEQRKMLERLEPREWFLIGKDGDHDGFLKMIRPPRVVAVAVGAMLAEHRGGKIARVDSMSSIKVAVHKRDSYVVEASGRDSRKEWPAMKRDGDEVCRRMAQGAKSPFNGRKGTPKLADRYSDNDLRDLMRVKESVKYKNWRTRKSAIKKLGIDPLPGRTWFLYQLESIARSRGVLE